MNPIVRDMLDQINALAAFPTLSSTISSVLDEIHAPDPHSDEQLARLVAADPTLTRKVLRLANSAMYEHFGQQIAQVSEAIKVVGMDAISYIALSLNVLNSFADTEAAADSNLELSKAVIASKLAYSVNLGAAIEAPAEDRALVTTVSNFAKLAVAFHLPGQWKEINARMRQGRSAEEAQTDVLGCTLNAIAREIFSAWNFPARLVSVAAREVPSELATVADFFTQVANAVIEKQDTLLQLVEQHFPGLDAAAHSAILGSLNQQRDHVLADETLTSIVAHRAVDFNVAQILATMSGTIEGVGEAVPKLLKGLDYLQADVLLIGVHRHRIGMAPSQFRVEYLVTRNARDKALRNSVFDLEQHPMLALSMARNADVYIKNVDHLQDAPTGDLPKNKAFFILPVRIVARFDAFVYLGWNRSEPLTLNDTNELRLFKALFTRVVNDATVAG